MWGSSGSTYSYTPYSPMYRVVPQPSHRFSRTEIRDLVIASLVLTLDLWLILTGQGLLYGGYGRQLLLSGSYLLILGDLAIAGLTAVLGFAAHEMAHKFAAQARGLWAEFRMSIQGLVFSVIFAFIGFLFAAPGATYIGGTGTREEAGVTSLAGPGVNLAMAAIFLLVYWPFRASIYSFIPATVAIFNIYLAGFNLLPFWVLDGAKVWRWNKGIWAASFGITVLFFLFVYFGLGIPFA